MLQEIRLPEPCIHSGLMSLLVIVGHAGPNWRSPL